MIILIYNHIRCRSHTCANSGECGAGFVCLHFRCGKKVEKSSVHKQDSVKYSISGNVNPSFGMIHGTVTEEPGATASVGRVLFRSDSLRNTPNSINSPGCGKAPVKRVNPLFFGNHRDIPDKIIHTGDQCKQNDNAGKNRQRPALIYRKVQN